MKRRPFLIGAILLGFLSACEKGNDDFKYVLSSTYACDTSLYISYDIDNQAYKYYQYNYPVRTPYQTIPFPDNLTELYYYEKNISFSNFVEDPTLPNLYGPQIIMKFWNNHLYDKTTVALAIANENNSNLSEDLKVNIDYKFVSPPRTPALKDSVFMKGVCLDGYTQNVMSAYNYDLPSILDFYSDNSYFKISIIKSVGKGYYLVTGDFETKGIDSKKDTINFKKGHFVFLTK